MDLAQVQLLSDKEKNAIEELQSRLENHLTPALREDFSLFYRFLKARDFDVDKAEKMLMKHITWRKISQIDTILEDIEPREYFNKYVAPTTIGVDKDGDVVIYAPCGKVETSDVLKCEKVNDYMKTWLWCNEKNLAFLKDRQKTGQKCNQFSYILDLDKLTFSNVTHKTTTEVWLRVTNLFQDNYPERLKSAYVINAPSYYVFVFTILKAVMSNVMIQKVCVFGQNGWKEKLLNVIDRDVLPAFLGGSRTDPDGNPLCLAFVNHGGRFSPHYYLSNEERYFEDKSQVKTIVVPQKGRKEVYLDVKETGCVIQWKYLVKSKDIGFGLSFQKLGQNVVEVIIPMERYSTVDGTDLGSYRSQAIGKYIIIFDNSHSWFSSKEIEYCLTVIKSE